MHKISQGLSCIKFVKPHIMVENAAFSLEEYVFNKVSIDIDTNEKGGVLNLDFQPSGMFTRGETNSTFELQLVFTANNEQNTVKIAVHGKAKFKFVRNIAFEEIPAYFYKNSIAIIFPYVRAFLSTVTLQANIPAIILPTMNLSSLESRLRENTKENA